MYDVFKRFSDIIISSIFIFLFSPLFFIVAFLIKQDSPGPVLFRQKRVGLQGKIFYIYKFRTMHCHMIGPSSTKNNDPRITRIGNILRKSSIDELPQLLNVLKGEMSLIGPRPDVPGQQELYTEAQRLKRASVRPGITGLSQALLRSIATQEQRISLDIEYIEKKSLIFDLKILCNTVNSLFSGKGN
jgi:lipopolysaccharide/colanic/teichoic acid biosynthesis glycosyltransferase